jgi:hypothetical protein
MIVAEFPQEVNTDIKISENPIMVAKLPQERGDQYYPLNNCPSFSSNTTVGITHLITTT